MSSWYIKLRIVLWLIMFCAVGWLLYMGIVPSGSVSYVYNFSEPNEFINKLTPNERLESVGDGKQSVIGDPVYFSLRTPRRFNKAILTMKYRNPSEMPIIESGVLVDSVVWRHDLKPVENKIIDQLNLVWNEVREGDTILLQRDVSTTSEEIKRYSSVQEFLDNLPGINEIATYNYDIDFEYLISDYEKLEEENIISYPLRGSFQFYTYIKDEKLDFVFDFIDLNNNEKEDDIEINLYYKDKLIDGRRISNEIAEKGTGIIKEEKGVALESVNLPEGVYKIELKVGDDIITESIITRQKKISFINKLWVHEAGGNNIKLFSDSNTINAQTINPANLQNIIIDDSELEINKTYKQFSVNTGGGVKEIILEKDDVIISGNGVFSFDEEGYLNPKVKKADNNLDINEQGVNYILANYNSPKEEEEWKVAEIDFDISNAYREDYKYSFLISIPGLRADDEIDDYIEISEIKFNLEGATLVEKIKKIFN